MLGYNTEGRMYHKCGTCKYNAESNSASWQPSYIDTIKK